jgi:hypothetical protein
MQRELDALALPMPVRILGVNAAGREAGNSAITAGRTLPWLQDTVAQDAWGRWGVTWRDVRILDASNELVAVYNLTRHDLANAAAYAELTRLLKSAAGGP